MSAAIFSDDSNENEIRPIELSKESQIIVDELRALEHEIFLSFGVPAKFCGQFKPSKQDN